MSGVRGTGQLIVISAGDTDIFGCCGRAIEFALNRCPECLPAEEVGIVVRSPFDDSKGNPEGSSEPNQKGGIANESRIRTATLALTRWFSSVPRSRVVLEVGTHSPWVSRLLSGLGHEVIVANPRRVRLIAESDRKHDRTDAEQLARLGRIDPQLLNPIQHRGKEAQEDLEVIRARGALVRARTMLINHARGAVKATGARLPSCSSQAILTTTALIYSLLESSIELNGQGAIIFLGFAVALGTVTYIYEGGQAYMARRFEATAGVALFPVALVIALVCVVASRLLNFQPGAVYGFVAAYALLTPAVFDRWQSARLILVPALALLVVGLVAWLLVLPLREAGGNDFTSPAGMGEAVTVLLFVAAVEGLLFNMIPLAFMNGKSIWDWNRLAWAALAIILVPLFWHVVRNQKESDIEALAEQGTIGVLAALTLCVTLSGATWTFFKLRATRASPKL